MKTKITRAKLEKAVAEADWTCCGCDEAEGCYEVRNSSPEGEDILLTLWGATFAQLADSAREAFYNFDPQDHAAQIYHAKHYGSADERSFYAAAPGDLHALLEDAEEIQHMYLTLESALRKAGARETNTQNRKANRK